MCCSKVSRSITEMLCDAQNAIGRSMLCDHICKLVVRARRSVLTIVDDKLAFCGGQCVPRRFQPSGHESGIERTSHSESITSSSTRSSFDDWFTTDDSSTFHFFESRQPTSLGTAVAFSGIGGSDVLSSLRV